MTFITPSGISCSKLQTHISFIINEIDFSHTSRIKYLATISSSFSKFSLSLWVIRLISSSLNRPLLLFFRYVICGRKWHHIWICNEFKNYTRNVLTPEYLSTCAIKMGYKIINIFLPLKFKITWGNWFEKEQTKAWNTNYWYRNRQLKLM